MTTESQKVITSALNVLGIPFRLGAWSSNPPDTYWVGEYQETPSMDESGMQETTFLLTGFTRKGWDSLEEDKEKIMSHFSKVGGKTVITASGAAVAVFYSNSLIVPTGDAELKRMQINLTIKEWSVK